MEFQGVEFSGQAPCMLLCSAGVEESPFCLSACSHSQLRAVLQVGQVLSLLAESIDPLQGLSFFRFSGPLNQWAYYIPDQEYLVLGLNVGPKCMREAGGFVERRAEWSTRGMGSDQWEVDRCPCLPARRPRELPLCLHRRPDEMNHAARGAVRALNLACRIGIADAEASLSLNRPWRVDAFLLPMCVCGSALSERGNGGVNTPIVKCACTCPNFYVLQLHCIARGHARTDRSMIITRSNLATTMRNQQRRT